MFLPREDFESWAAPSAGRFPANGADWRANPRPSALRFLFTGEEDCETEERMAEIREAMYSALENDEIEKLNRGLMFTQRTTKTGTVYGILACVDLEAFSEQDDGAFVRPAQEICRNPALQTLRGRVPLEFPRARIFYRDKHCKIVRALLDEDLEVCYDFDLMEGGGRLVGRFIPEDLAEDIFAAIHVGKPPYFLLADAEADIAAAKDDWEERKRSLNKAELARHPARYALAELVNVCENDVALLPVHRVVRETDSEAFLDFYSRNVKSTVKGSYAYCAIKDPAAAVRKTDEVIAEYLRKNGGRVDYVTRLEGETAVVLRGIEKEDLFSRVKNGPLPAHTFSFGEARDKRYLLEGREIGYD